MNRDDVQRKVYWISGLLAVFLLAFVVSIIFLNPSSVGNQNFIRNFNIWAFVWAILFVVVLVLTVILARNLIRLLFEYQAGGAGSRIKSKLILTFIIFSLFPALIMAFLAFGLINQNLATWVSAPSEQLLESSRLIARSLYDQREREARAVGQLLAERLDSAEVAQKDPLLVSELLSYGFSGVLILDAGGQMILQEGAFPLEDTLARLQALVLRGETAYTIIRQVNIDPGIVDLGLIGLPLRKENELVGALFLTFSIPESIAFHVDAVSEANQVYEGLKGTLVSLRLTYVLVLTLTTLAVVFGFVWLGSYIAKKLTVPLEALAEGSRELADGNLDYRVGVRGVDELGILVDAFNRMAAQIKENRVELESANIELKTTNVHLDERRRYIETVLQNIATGVVTIDESEIIRTANQAALKMLQTTPEAILNRSLRSVTDPELNRNFQDMRKKARLYGTYRQQLTIQRNGRQLYVAATVTTNQLPLNQGVEYLMVLDDLTELIRAEKFAAWQEVARRLAHEIKNPLTPIQLSAERIKRRFDRLRPQLPPHQGLDGFEEVLTEATQIISSESRMLKNLLAEFSRFARMPICKPTEVNLHELIDKTLQQYQANLRPITVKKEFDPRIRAVRADPEQLQRVFVNLIDNSMDALVEESRREIEVSTALQEARHSVKIEFCDNGHGIPADDYKHLFLPYFSTKRKGTGLGLAIVRQIVTEHNGFIRAEPNRPKGTRIVLEIPLGVTSDEGKAAYRR